MLIIGPQTSDGPIYASLKITQPADQTGSIITTVSISTYFGVIARNDFSDWQIHPIALSLFKTNPQILAHPVNSKAKIKFTSDHGFAAIDHLPGLCRPAGNRRK